MRAKGHFFEAQTICPELLPKFTRVYYTRLYVFSMCFFIRRTVPLRRTFQQTKSTKTRKPVFVLPRRAARFIVWGRSGELGYNFDHTPHLTDEIDPGSRISGLDEGQADDKNLMQSLSAIVMQPGFSFCRFGVLSLELDLGLVSSFSIWNVA